MAAFRRGNRTADGPLRRRPARENSWAQWRANVQLRGRAAAGLSTELILEARAAGHERLRGMGTTCYSNPERSVCSLKGLKNNEISLVCRGDLSSSAGRL